ncbi:hypothetical protein HDU97_002298 [Phlyctochytrium planicorne]|nr:hypothetical protein HDU97_002298 [Phlyctochytrium planicorne]
MVTSASTDIAPKTIVVTLQPSASPVTATMPTASVADVPPAPSSGSTVTMAAIAGSVVVVVLLAAGLFAFMWRRNRQKKATIEDVKMSNLPSSYQVQPYYGNHGTASTFSESYKSDTLSKPVTAFNQPPAQEHQNQFQSPPEKSNPLFGFIPESNQPQAMTSSTPFQEQHQQQQRQAWPAQSSQEVMPIFKSRDEYTQQPVPSPARSKATYDPSQIGQATSQGEIILPTFDEVSRWDRDRVANLLESMELSSRVVSTLHDRNVTGYELLVMTEDRLLEFGIHQAIAREIILSVVARLRQGSSASVGIGVGGSGSGPNNLPEYSFIS